MHSRILPAAIAAALLSACASNAPKTPPPSVGYVVPSSAQKPGDTYDPRVAEAQRRARQMGYHVEIRHGVEFFCRTVAPISSRIPEKECITVDGMAQAAQMNDENRAVIMQSRNCQGGGCTIN